jgi:alcohol dehydrogenase (cytochrome c)
MNAAKVTTAGRRTKPGINGGVNWQNPAFDQARGTIFVPAEESSSVFTKAAPGEMVDTRNGMYVGSSWSETDPAINEVVALDGATGQRRWQHTTPTTTSNDGGHSSASYAGLLSTSTGLVFGASGGVLFALDADSGREIWRLPLGGTTKSPPISFTIDGHQVIAVSAGRALFVLGL